MIKMTKEHLLKHRKISKRRKPIFLRKDWHKMDVLGRSNKKKQKWRKAGGRHNKIRKKMAGQQKMPSIGYRSPRLVRRTIDGKLPVLINNINDLKNAQNENAILIASKVGGKKRIEIARMAKEKGIKIINLDIEKIISENKENKPEEKENPKEKTK